MRTKRIGWTALAAALAVAAPAFLAAPSGASPSWTAYPGGIRPPSPALATAAGAHATPTTCYRGLCEYVAGAVVTGASTTAVSAVLDQPRPKVAPNERSATAIAVESGNAKQSITFGWMVSKKLFGDTLPHIVISSVVNGVLQCINGCGFVPVVKNAPKISINHSGKYAIKLSKAKWLLVYNGKTLGYYPTSQFPGHKLERAGVAVALGQVASPSKSKPKSDMGNGKLGTGARSAKVRDLQLTKPVGTPTFHYLAVDAPAKYNIGFINAACHNGCSMNYGGPGF